MVEGKERTRGKARHTRQVSCKKMSKKKKKNYILAPKNSKREKLAQGYIYEPERYICRRNPKRV